MNPDVEQCLAVIRRSVRVCAEANFPYGPCRLCIVTLRAALNVRIDMEDEWEENEEEEFVYIDPCSCRDGQININCSGCF